MRIISIVGARPQFIKLAPVSRELKRRNLEAGRNGEPYHDLIVHTGQHYDRSMSDVFFDELEIPPTHADLDIGSGPHGAQTGAMLSAIEAQLVEARPDVVVVYGDTNSTLAGCLAAAKLHLPLVHVEAGLRSFNRKMPEEVNRVVADHTCDVLLAPTPAAMENLASENLQSRSRRVGDVMHDAVIHASRLANEHSAILADLKLAPDSYGLVTIHRAENTTRELIPIIFAALEEIAKTQIPLVFPMHPRTKALIRDEMAGWRPPQNLLVIEPVGYFDMMALLGNARVMLTDSGGVQKEAMFLGTPCVTLRDETEWVETVETGANRLAGIDRDLIVKAARESLTTTGGDSAGPDWMDSVNGIFGDGNCASLIVDEIDALVR